MEQSGKKHQGKKKDFNRFLEVKETMADRTGQMMVNFFVSTWVGCGAQLFGEQDWSRCYY